MASEKYTHLVPNKVPNKVANKVTNKVPNKVTNKALGELIINSKKQMEQHCFVLIRDNPNITIFQMAFKMGISQSWAKKLLIRLKTAGKIKRVGAKRNGYWEVVD